MSIGDLILANFWLFIGLAAVPAGLIVVLFAYLTFSRSQRVPENWSLPAFYAALASIPVVVSAVGFVLACALSMLQCIQPVLATNQWFHIYLNCFTVAWNLVFVPLSIFNFFMGFSAFPPPNSVGILAKLLVVVYGTSYVSVVITALLVSSAMALILSVIAVCFATLA